MSSRALNKPTPQDIACLANDVEHWQKRAKFFEAEASRLTRVLNQFADMHEQCDVSQAESP